MNDILDETEVASLLDCEPRTVQDKARSGELPAVKFGRSWRFPREALLARLNELAMTRAAKPEPKPSAAVAMPVHAARGRRRGVLPPLVDMRS